MTSLPPEVAELDREWESYRATWLPRATNGEYEVPDPDDCRIGAWLTGAVGVLAALILVFLGFYGMSVLSAAAALVVILVLRRQAEVGRVFVRSLANYHAARRALLTQFAAWEVPVR